MDDASIAVTPLGTPENPETYSKKGKKISRKLLINKLNFINFQDGSILIHFTHRKYNSTLSLPAKPQPCFGDKLECIWSEPADLRLLHAFDITSFCLEDAHRLIVAETEVIRHDENGIVFSLPETSYAMNNRTIRRHHCSDIKVQLVQNGAVFNGSLVDFSGASFRIELSIVPPQTLLWINSDVPVNILLFSNEQMMFSGECLITKQTVSSHKKSLILKPLHSEIRRFSARETRSTRHKLVPTPRICFNHPLIKKIFSLEVFDISGSGLSVEEDAGKSVLVPGLILPNVEFSLAGSLNVQCTLQVIYKKLINDETIIRSGLTILDISPGDHVKILALVQQVKDKKSYVCNRITSNQLWNFFFDTGFIYPGKYKHLAKRKHELKQTIDKLYDGEFSLARHFVYQDDEQILGHMSMLRFYEKTWLIHHHASKKTEQFNAGLNVLNYLSRSIIDSHSLFSAHMNYLACYYRPDNKFPNRIFGGVAKYINDKTACSVDTFAYFKYTPSVIGDWGMTGARWALAKAEEEELKEFNFYYDKTSGGLMLPAFDLEEMPAEKESISSAFQDCGLKRERHIYCLKKDEAVKAIVVVTLSELGLNLSNLTNCLHVFITDSAGLGKDTLLTTLLLISNKHVRDEIPVLLYPLSYAEEAAIPFEKIYNLFIIDTAYSDPYFRFLKNFFRFSNHKNNDEPAAR